MKDHDFFQDLMAFKAQIDALIASEDFSSLMIPAAEQVSLPLYLEAFRKLSCGGKRIRAYLVRLGLFRRFFYWARFVSFTIYGATVFPIGKAR